MSQRTPGDPAPAKTETIDGRLKELAWLFLKLGTIAFGGPAAHIAMMEDEVVRRKRWLSREDFLDLFAATHLIPGPNSTEMAIHIGHKRAGFAGLLVGGGICFILPAALIVLALAWMYVRLGKLPEAAGVLYGVKPVVIAVVLQALWGLGRTAVKTKFLAATGIAVMVANFLGANELLLLLMAGVAVYITRFGTTRLGSDKSAPALFLGVISAFNGASAASSVTAFGLWPLFLFFLKVGSVLFGSGYVLLAFLRADLVERWHWLTEAQLLDAIAIGQVTPGPVFTTATFIGYLLAGAKGGLIATLGIFLPAFVFVAISGPLVPRMRRSLLVGAFLDGVVVASLGLMAVVTLQLLRAALVDWITVLSAAVSTLLLFRYKTNSAWLVLGGAIVGLALSLLHGSP